MEKLDFVCAGSATEDVFVRSDLARILTMSDQQREKRFLCFDYGGKVPVEHIEFTTGGGATNAAVSLSLLGARVACICKIGTDDPGQLIVKELQAKGIDTALVKRSSKVSTGYSVILTSYEGDRTVLTHRGASTRLHDDDIDWSIFARTKWLYLTSLSGDSDLLTAPLIQHAAQAGARVAMNPGSTQIKAGIDGMRDILKQIDVLLLNKEEAAQLSGLTPVRDAINMKRCALCGKCVEFCPGHVFLCDESRLVANGFERCIRCGKCVTECAKNAIAMEPCAYNLGEVFDKLKKAGPKVIVITDGANGSQAFDGNDIYLAPSIKTEVASTLGAGDAFGSAFVFEYSRSGDIARALALGSLNAGSVVQSIGAKNGLLSADIAEAALAKYDLSVVRKADVNQLVAAING